MDCTCETLEIVKWVCCSGLFALFLVLMAGPNIRFKSDGGDDDEQ